MPENNTEPKAILAHVINPSRARPTAESNYKTPTRPDLDVQTREDTDTVPSRGTVSTTFSSPFSPSGPSTIWDDDGPLEQESAPSSPASAISWDPRHNKGSSINKTQNIGIHSPQALNSSDLIDEKQSIPSHAQPVKALSNTPHSGTPGAETSYWSRAPCLQCSVKNLCCDKTLPACSRCVRCKEGQLCLARRWMTAEEIAKQCGSKRWGGDTVMLDLGAYAEDNEIQSRRAELAERVSCL